jgi:glycosyltransferase involved in cell wall biosynthesis
MNVAIFTDNDFDQVNGVTTTLRAVLHYAPEDIRPCIYTASEFGDDGPGYFAPRSIKMSIPCYRETRMYLPRIREYVRRVRRDRITLIHVTTPGPIGVAGIYAARRSGLPVVGTFHTDLAAYTPQLRGSRLIRNLVGRQMRWMYSRCDRVLVPSESARERLISAHVDPRQIDLWRRGVDADLFSPAKRSLALRERWRVCERRPAVMYVGRLSREKGLGMLRAVQSAMYRRGVEHRLLLVGDGPCRRELQAELPDALFTGMLRPAEAAIALASADLFLFPSDTDTDGQAVLEAQASGVPVLVPSLGGPKEYIRPDETGIVCHAGSAEAFGHAAAMVLLDAPRRQRMSEAARAYALALRWQSTLAALYRAYTELLAVERTRRTASSVSQPSRDAAA